MTETIIIILIGLLTFGSIFIIGYFYPFWRANLRGNRLVEIKIVEIEIYENSRKSEIMKGIVKVYFKE